MFSYYLDKGHSLDKLINLSHTEKIFYQQSMLHNRKLEIAKHNAMWGGK
jgi:hypothetical protein